MLQSRIPIPPYILCFPWRGREKTCTMWILFLLSLMLQPSGTISTCESSLCRRQCPPPSTYILFLLWHPRHSWVDQAAAGVSTSYDALVQIFDRVGNFLKRLQIYAKIPFTPPMVDIIVQIMLEILSVLALTTAEIKQGRFSK
jgi:hypothetical protein